MPAARQTAPAADVTVDAAPDPLPPPTNVVAALARVQAEIGGIEKLTSAQRGRARDGEAGVPYPYRGIDDIAAKCQPLFGRYGVVVVPYVTTSSVDQITVGNKPWTDTTIEVEWRVYGPGGVDDCIVARTHGLGRDNSDKGYNKATTSAYKNLLLRLLCIGDPADDTDGTTHETAPDPAAEEERAAAERDASAQARGFAGYDAFRDRWAATVERARHLAARHGEEVSDAYRRLGIDPKTISAAALTVWEATLDDFESLPAPEGQGTLPVGGGD